MSTTLSKVKISGYNNPDWVIEWINNNSGLIVTNKSLDDLTKKPPSVLLTYEKELLINTDKIFQFVNKLNIKNLVVITMHLYLFDKKLLEKNNIANIFEFQWWDTMSINDIDITFTPVQHWSARGIFDRNKSLWGGWYFTAHGLKLFHAGDSGYSKDFVDIKNKLGAPDLAFIPIGAYDPEWFMSESHMNPEEAVKVSLDLNAKQSIGMHWGTFTLTSEDTIDPFNRVNSLKNHNLKTIKPGEYLIF